MAPATFKIIYEVKNDPNPAGYTLCFQWGYLKYSDGSPSEHGYRFIYRKPNGNLQAARAQARIPSVAAMMKLIERARAAGWLEACEGA